MCCCRDSQKLSTRTGSVPHTSAIPWPLYPFYYPLFFHILVDSFAGFRTHQKLNSSILKRFRTLYQKHWWA